MRRRARLSKAPSAPERTSDRKRRLSLTLSVMMPLPISRRRYAGGTSYFKARPDSPPAARYHSRANTPYNYSAKFYLRMPAISIGEPACRRAGAFSAEDYADAALAATRCCRSVSAYYFSISRQLRQSLFLDCWRRRFTFISSIRDASASQLASSIEREAIRLRRARVARGAPGGASSLRRA